MSRTTRTLGDICDEVGGVIRTGPFGSQLHDSDYRPEGTPVVMPKNIIDGRISTDEIARIDDDDVARLAQHKLRPGDIVYGRRGDIGRRALITERESGWLCGTGCLRVSLGDSILCPTFLHYYLGDPSVVAWIANRAIGATLPNLNTAILRSVPVTYPSVPTQRKIGSVLSAYDDLMANNTRRITVLEEVARALYGEWFVYFRFPGHETAELVDSPLGPIPEGWQISNFTELADVLSGGTPKTTVDEYWGSDIPFFSPRDAGSSFYVTQTEKAITELGLDHCSSQLYPRDTVFITARGTVGKVVLAASSMAMNQSCYALVARSNISQPYLFLATLHAVDHLKKQTGGATFDTIIVDTFRRLSILKPAPSLVQDFTDTVRPMFDLIRGLALENENLRVTRDFLLPRLVSGELDVEGLEIETKGLVA